MTQWKAETSARAHFSSLMHLLQPCKVLCTENSEWKRIGRKSLPDSLCT